MRNKETDMTLETRIETAIAENIDPFTTDADIRFFETEEWNAEVTLGTKIIGDFGGYESLWEGEVVAVECFDVGPAAAEKEVKVEWGNGSTTWICRSEIDAKKGKIGYFTEEGFYG
jgi:hypothetical protein